MKNVNLFNIEYDGIEVGKRISNELQRKGKKISNICSILPDGSINPDNHVYITRQTLSKFVKGSGSDLTLRQFIELCNILECSPEYLLGMQKYTTNEKQQVGNLTGISEEAIDILSSWKDGDGSYNYDSRLWSKILSEIITHPRFQEVIEKTHDAIIEKNNLYIDVYRGNETSPVRHYFETQAKEKMDSCIFNTSRIFANIIEDIVNNSDTISFDS